MDSLAHDVEINRLPEDVFAYVTDPSRFAEWQEAVVEAHPPESGPMGLDSRFQLTRRMGPRTQTMTVEITEWDAPRSYAFRVLDGPVRAIGKGRLEPTAGGDRTRFSFELDFEGHGIGKLLIPLVVRRQSEKEMVASHHSLKRQLEGTT